MSENSVKNLEVMEAIAAGEFGFSAEELAGAVSFTLRVSSGTATTTAVAVALIRRDHIRDAAAWVNWARDRFGLEGSYLHHLHKVGKMLIGLRECLGDTQKGAECCNNTADARKGAECCNNTADARKGAECCNNTVKMYRTLFAAGFDKLLPVTRIPAEQLAAFLSHLRKPIDKMTRGEVRMAVAEWLGESGRTAAESVQPDLPGFDRALDTVWRLEPADLVAAVNNDDKAVQSLRAGMGLLGAALEFEKRRECPDVATLQAAKAALLSEIEEIEAVIAKAL